MQKGKLFRFTTFYWVFPSLLFPIWCPLLVSWNNLSAEGLHKKYHTQLQPLQLFFLPSVYSKNLDGNVVLLFPISVVPMAGLLQQGERLYKFLFGLQDAGETCTNPGAQLSLFFLQCTCTYCSQFNFLLCCLLSKWCYLRYIKIIFLHRFLLNIN